ncbi:flagellar brake protein [Gorillibacterium massiliense]|uniref:flagellar brake protein n=1 Tax=Gorillibacterium massiliense TaxID=1280390 RepID=UPI0004B503E8|nr:flagellar brake domain-containing protein [Gorillibacterium massiliense]
MLPSVNQALYLQINTIDEEEAKQEYKARIADDLGDRLALEIPMNEQTGRLKRFYVGDELSTYFVSDGGFKNFFTTTVMGYREDGIRQVIVRKPREEEIGRVQRRNFLRMPAELEVSLTTDLKQKVLGVTEDVGGGGISFTCEKNISLDKGRKTEGWLLLPPRNGKPDHVFFKGMVVRAIDTEFSKSVIMRFTEMADKERQKIIRFCFEREQIIRKS